LKNLFSVDQYRHQSDVVSRDKKCWSHTRCTLMKNKKCKIVLRYGQRVVTIALKE